MHGLKTSTQVGLNPGPTELIVMSLMLNFTE